MPFKIWSLVPVYIDSSTFAAAASFTPKLFKLSTAMALFVPRMVRARVWDQGRPRGQEIPFPAAERKSAIEPSIASGFQSRRAGLHIVLRIEVRAGRVRRTCGMDDRQAAVAQRSASGSQATGCRPKNPSRSMTASLGSKLAAGTRNRDRGAEVIVVLIAVRDNDV